MASSSSRMRRLAAASARCDARAAPVRLPVCAQATARRTDTKSKRARFTMGCASVTTPRDQGTSGLWLSPGRLLGQQGVEVLDNLALDLVAESAQQEAKFGVELERVGHHLERA
jgi:hypothetical protein